MEQVYNTFIVPSEKSTIVHFTSSIMKNIFMFPVQSRFPIESESAVSLLKQHRVFVVFLDLLQSAYNFR